MAAGLFTCAHLPDVIAAYHLGNFLRLGCGSSVSGHGVEAYFSAAFTRLEVNIGLAWPCLPPKDLLLCRASHSRSHPPRRPWQAGDFIARPRVHVAYIHLLISLYGACRVRSVQCVLKLLMFLFPFNSVFASHGYSRFHSYIDIWPGKIMFV